MAWRITALPNVKLRSIVMLVAAPSVPPSLHSQCLRQRAFLQADFIHRGVSLLCPRGPYDFFISAVIAVTPHLPFASVAYLFIHDRTHDLFIHDRTHDCTHQPSLFPSHLQHYNLNTENLQHVCLRLSCKTRSLVNEINAFYGPPPDEFQVSLLCLNNVAADAVLEIWDRGDTIALEIQHKS